MSLKAKLTLLLSLWLIVILLLYNVFVLYFFINVSTNSEIELLQQKAITLMERDLMNQPEFWEDPNYIKEFLIPNEMIRIIGKDSSVKRIMGTDAKLLKYPAKYMSITGPNSVQDISLTEGISVYVQVPIYADNEQVAVLEIGRQLSSLEKYIGMLVSVLIFTSIGAIIASLLGGYFYARVIFEPISRLAHTMEAIYKSGTFKRLEIAPSDKNNEISQLGHTFNEMIAKLELTFERQRQFIGDASHELRTPLTIIESYASLLRRWASNDPALREEALDAILSESIRMKELINNLLLLIDTDEEERVKWVTFDLRALIESTASSIQLTFKREITAHYPSTDDEPILMKGDPEKIKQLVIIMLDNAIKYSKKPIEIHVAKEFRHIKIQVVDQGIGIAKEDIPHLFDRFYRTDKARNRKHGGVGLGLSIAENIVNLHQGTIAVDSTPGEGTTITIRFPRKV